jgi:hypothetical protein
MVSTQGLLAHEVTSYKLNLPLTRPARVGSLGPQTNGLCDIFGNVREWLANSQSAGFSFDTQGYGKGKLLLVDGTGFKDSPITGFRCLLQEGK